MDLLNYDDDNDDDEDEDKDKDESTNHCMGAAESNKCNNQSTPVATGSNNQHVLRTRKRPRESSSLTIVSSDEAPPNLFERIVPHRRGHWSGHVVVPISQSHSNRTTSSHAAIQQSIQDFYQLLQDHEFTTGTIVQHSHYHLSLSKYFSLQLAFIDSFVQKLTRRLATERSTRALLVQQHGRPLECILVNDEKTRSFWCWKVQSNPVLLRILHHVDACLKEYGQPAYYHPPLFHISIASFDGDLSSLVPLAESRRQERATKMDITTTAKDDPENKGEGDDDDDEQEEDSESDDDDSTNTLDSNLIKIDRLVCKFGTTKTYTIPLAGA